MRKSTSIRLALLGSAGLGLAACDDGPPPDAHFYASPEECAKVQPDSVCRDAFAKSQTAYATEAPRYGRKEECEAQFGVGHCETQTSGGGSGFFMPMMMGYMMGNAFSSPVYRDRDNNAITTSRSGNAYRVGGFQGAGQQTAYAPGPVTRSGLGATASRSGFSSGT